MTTTTTTTGATTTVAPVGMPDQRPWATYERRSRIGKGATMTMDNQHAENLAHVQAVAPGAAVVDYRDNASGWDEQKVRKQWDQLLLDLAAGQYAGVVAWHSDRYTRQPEQLEQLIKAVRKGRTQLHTRLAGHHSDPTMIRIEMALAAKESDTKSERGKLFQGELARDGKPHGGRRAYGYNAERTALNEDEAAHVRWAADQVLAGASIRSITAGLAERGSVTVSGKPWRASNLGTYLRQPMLAGLRTHHGEVVGKASWPELLDPGKWEAVRSILANPSRRISKRAARVYLLTGIARCGGCGATMRGRSNASAGKASAYFCDHGQGCAYRRADLVDAQVRAEVVERLTQVDATGAMAEPVTDLEVGRFQLSEQISELEANLNGLVGMALRGAITQAMLESATKEATEQIAELEQQRGQLAVEARRPSAVLSGLAGKANAADLFDAAPLETQRAVVAELCSVTILPSARGQKYDPALVRIDWLA